jgi:hypothetical protein
MNHLIILAISSVAWVVGGILLYPTLHWKGLIGLLLVMFAYRLEAKSSNFRKSKVDIAADNLIRSVIEAKGK